MNKTAIALIALLGATGNECVKSVEEMEHIRSLALQAIDQGFKDHVTHLYGVWIRDYPEAQRRAYAGMKNTLSAYHRARADVMLWNPPVCR